MPLRRAGRILFLCFSMTLAGCASNSRDSIETRGEFASREESGKTQFVYTYYWFNPVENQIDRRDRQTRMFAYLSGYSAPLTSEQKIRLEDEAAVNLENAISERQLCNKGYDIEQVIWRERSLSLIGECA